MYRSSFSAVSLVALLWTAWETKTLLPVRLNRNVERAHGELVIWEMDRTAVVAVYLWRFPCCRWRPILFYILIVPPKIQTEITATAVSATESKREALEATVASSNNFGAERHQLQQSHDAFLLETVVARHHTTMSTNITWTLQDWQSWFDDVWFDYCFGDDASVSERLYRRKSREGNRVHYQRQGFCPSETMGVGTGAYGNANIDVTDLVTQCSELRKWQPRLDTIVASMQYKQQRRKETRDSIRSTADEAYACF
jgi:hypothetical protein